MNKLIDICISVIAAIAFIGLFAENTDGSLPVIWTFSCIGVLALCLKHLDRKLSKTE